MLQNWPSLRTNCDDYWADISIIPEQSELELYARGRPGIVCGTGVIGDVTFIAGSRHTEADVFNANFSQFCVGYIDEYWTYISIVSAQSDGEW